MMSVRRCADRCLSWSRHAHHLNLSRHQRAVPSLIASRDLLSASASIVPGRSSQYRLNHDETSNLGTQVTIDITNKQYSKDDEDDGDESAENIYVTSYSTTGLKLSNKFAVVGPCILFPRTVLSWNVASARDITPESLTLFSLLEPRLDVLVIGIGDGSIKPPDTPALVTYCKRLGINVEILNTEEACSTFNFLNGERRYVAAAIVPPKDVSLFSPEYFLHDDFATKDDIMEQSLPYDPSNPKNWYLNPDGINDNNYDKNMTRIWAGHGLVTRRDAAEMRHTEEEMREEIDAMEDRFTPDGEKVITDLDKQAKEAIEKDYEEYERTGEISLRLQLHLNTKDKPTSHVEENLPILEPLEEYREIKWHGLDKSRRFRKKFDKLYDVGQDEVDYEEEGRKLAAEEKMTLLGEEDTGDHKPRLIEEGGK